MTLRSPIKWFGGKGNMVKKLIDLMPPHEFYVEVFGGGASLLFAKPPAKLEVYNDLDEGLVGFFRVLRDPDSFGAFYHLATMTPYARAEYNHCRDTWRGEKDPIIKAYKWFVVARWSFSGRFESGFGTATTSINRGMISTSSRWLSIIEMLPALHERVMRVQIECQDWRTILDRYNDPRYLAYLDPPYVHETRKDKRYAHELNTEDHIDLVARLLEYPGMAMLSGYPNAIYDDLERHGWDKKEFETACFAVGRTRHTGVKGAGSALEKQKRVEVVWRNLACMRAQKQGSLF